MCTLFLVIVCVFRILAEGKTTLHVGVLLELSDYWYSSYTNFYDDVLDYAFREIEERDDILKDFNFEMTIQDTKVSSYGKET